MPFNNHHVWHPKAKYSRLADFTVRLPSLIHKEYHGQFDSKCRNKPQNRLCLPEGKCNWEEICCYYRSERKYGE